MGVFLWLLISMLDFEWVGIEDVLCFFVFWGRGGAGTKFICHLACLATVNHGGNMVPPGCVTCCSLGILPL